MTLREKVVEVLLNWLATFVRDTRDENVSAEQVADAILALLSTADSEQREVADLRRKLEAVTKERDDYEEREAACCPEDFGFDEVIDCQRRQLSSSSLTIAALRTALGSARSMFYGGHPCYPGRAARDFRVYEDHWNEWVEKTEAALRLPADSLAQEVVWLLRNAEPYGMSVEIKERKEYHDRRDALLARIGGKT